MDSQQSEHGSRIISADVPTVFDLGLDFDLGLEEFDLGLEDGDAPTFSFLL